MGRVYEALDKNSGQTFALKIMMASPNRHRGNSEALRREADTQKAIVHPNIVRLFEFIEGENQYALVLELVRGQTLHEVIAQQRGKLSVSWAIRSTMAMCVGLQEIHEHHFVHSDIKPANFIVAKHHLNKANILKVIDFGISRSLKEGAQDRRQRVLSGTPPYMAPEQFKREPLSNRSDLYSLGCILFEILTGQPYCQATDVESAGNFHIGASIPDLQKIRSDVPHKLSEITKSLLQKKPDHRPNSAKEVNLYLEALLHEVSQ